MSTSHFLLPSHEWPARQVCAHKPLPTASQPAPLPAHPRLRVRACIRHDQHMDGQNTRVRISTSMSKNIISCFCLSCPPTPTFSSLCTYLNTTWIRAKRLLSAALSLLALSSKNNSLKEYVIERKTKDRSLGFVYIYICMYVWKRVCVFYRCYL